ncbi:MAG: TIGR04255 family protein [bacterium]
MNEYKDDLPKYRNPPVVEVALGVFFEDIKSMKLPHSGVFWQKIRKEFPRVTHADPLGILEDDITKLPLPRVWFINEHETNLIQYQTNCFFFNWRKIPFAEKYPRYSTVKKAFERYHNLFIEFLHENNMGKISYKQCELTYVNHIPKDNIWNSPADINQIMRDIIWTKNENRFLPEPKSIQWFSIFSLPDDFGELKISLKHGKRISDDYPLFILEISAKGLGGDRTPERISEWFDLAHEWIVNAFADITSDDMQKKCWLRQSKTKRRK